MFKVTLFSEDLTMNTSKICMLRPNKDGLVGQGVKFERIRRVTGYLVGSLDRFNDGKRAEVKDRVKHLV